MRLISIVMLVGSYSQVMSQQKLMVNEAPLVCGHRGGFYSRYPENSIALMNYVMEKVKDATVILEIDIRRSKNGTLYILHDETVNRTTNGHGKISELSDEYINSLFLKNDKGNLSDQRILPLVELLQQLKNKKCQLMLDIKANVWRETADLIMNEGWHDRSVFLTFNPEHTKILMNYSDQLTVSALIRNYDDWNLLENITSRRQKRIAYVPRDASVELIDKLKQDGYKIMADVSEYTTHGGTLYAQSYYLKLVRDKKLDILITDFPVEVTQYMNE